MKQKKNRSNYWKKNCSGKTIQCPQHDTRGSRSHFFRLRLHSCPKFFNPVIFQIWEFASCSDLGYNHRSNRNLTMFLLKKWPHRLLLLPKFKSDCGFGSRFSQIFDSGSGSGSERRAVNQQLNRRIFRELNSITLAEMPSKLIPVWSAYALHITMPIELCITYPEMLAFAHTRLAIVSGPLMPF